MKYSFQLIFLSRFLSWFFILSFRFLIFYWISSPKYSVGFSALTSLFGEKKDPQHPGSSILPKNPVFIKVIFNQLTSPDLLNICLIYLFLLHILLNFLNVDLDYFLIQNLSKLSSWFWYGNFLIHSYNQHKSNISEVQG